MSIRPNQPQTIGGVLDISFQLYKASLGSVWPLSLLLILASSPQQIYLVMHGAFSVNSADPMAILAIYGQPGYWLCTLLGLALSMWVLAALFKKVNAIGADEALGIGSALQLGAGNILSLVLMTVAAAIVLVIGMILLLVPGLILMVSLALGTVLVVVEGKGPIQALTGSHKLVWGDWWRTVAIFSVGFIIVIVAYFAIAFVAALILPFLGAANDPVLTGLLSVLIIGGLMSVLFLPYYVALLLSVYWDLKLRKEGGDLAARVSALGTT